MKKTVRAWVCLVFLLGVPIASANWGTTSTGSRCQRAIYQHTDLGYYSPGTLGNEATSESYDLTVICGVARPHFEHDRSPNGTRAYDRVQGTVYVSDMSSDEAVTARMKACSETYSSCIYTAVTVSATTFGTTSISPTASTMWVIGSSRKTVAFEVVLPDRDSTSSRVLGYETNFTFVGDYH